MPRRSFTFFLAKEAKADFSNYLTENARAALAAPTTQHVELQDFGEQAEIFIFKGFPSPPKWLSQIRASFPAIQTFDTFSGAGVLLLSVNGSVFAITFSHGWMYIDEDFFTSDFGLKVAVNGLDHSKLRRLERSNLGDAIKGVSQSAFQREFRSFGIDDALELIQKLAGSTRDGINADAMAGSRSLKITGDYEIADLPAIATDLLQLYSSTSYQKTEFRVIDAVQPITDGPLIARLNRIAAHRIKMGRDSFELGMPSSIESEGIAFKFHGPGVRQTHPDLLLRHYVAALQSRGKLSQLNAEMLDKHKVEAILDENRPSLTWSMRKSLIGSVSSRTSRYAINEGTWFRIDDLFRQSVEDSFIDTMEPWAGQLPIPIATIYDEQGNGTLEREEDYNARLATQYGFALLDKTQITVPNVSRSGFEPCDLLDIQGRRFIHIKKSSRQSSILSHFFKQGSNSARQFKRIPDAWNQLIAELLATNQANHASQLQGLANRESGWSVEYWIVDSPRAAGDFNIPFFSKISLRDERLDMMAMEYQVALRFIAKAAEPLNRFQR
ncbi:DUF6119 family protein [Aquicoccus porphyridii]|uniref:DUF6119 family protein n=1 Tax=Aquicoccus porphyridii TaxID=1852029 RepID=UPI00273EEB89|nr:TIGR04141 family sporadically distributed protein [Aquicoccus porphyridii]